MDTHLYTQRHIYLMILNNAHSSDNKAYRCPRRVSTVVCIHDPECTVPDCSGHGECNDAYQCVCRDPWIGYGCHLVNCTKSNCLEHGSCSEGTSLCPQCVLCCIIFVR